MRALTPPQKAMLVELVAREQPVTLLGQDRIRPCQALARKGLLLIEAEAGFRTPNPRLRVRLTPLGQQTAEGLSSRP